MSESEGNSFNENEDDHVVGLVEYINGQNAEIEQANLILEASEGDSCTYSMVCNRTLNLLLNSVYILIMFCSRVI